MGHEPDINLARHDTIKVIYSADGTHHEPTIIGAPGHRLVGQMRKDGRVIITEFNSDNIWIRVIQFCKVYRMEQHRHFRRVDG